MNVSIIIPCYKQAHLLPQALQSALSQTVLCEVIVVNDGSPDDIRDVFEPYKAKAKLVNQTNKGLPSARNTGIMNATGDYIIPLDADDLIRPTYAEMAIRYAEEYQKKFGMLPDVLYPDMDNFGLSEGSYQFQDDYTLAEFLDCNRIPYCSALRRSTLLSIGGYNPRMVYGWEDWDLWIDLKKRGARFAHIPRHLFLYRTKKESMLADSYRHAKELSEQMRKNHQGLPWPQSAQ